MDDVTGSYEVGSSDVLEQEADVVPCPICRKTFLVKDIEVTAWYTCVSCNHFVFLGLASYQFSTGLGFCLHVNLSWFSCFCGRHMHQNAMNTVKRRFHLTSCVYLSRAAALRWPHRARSKYRKGGDRATCTTPIAQAWISGIVFCYWYQFWRVSCVFWERRGVLSGWVLKGDIEVRRYRDMAAELRVHLHRERTSQLQTY